MIEIGSNLTAAIVAIATCLGVLGALWILRDKL